MKRFFKYEGCGNDFIIFDQTPDPNFSNLLDSDFVKKLCNRHFGIGADGILLLQKGPRSPFFMKIYNADGSEPEMCGNGIRCFVKYLVDRLKINGNPIKIETKAGLKTCSYKLNKSGLVSEVTVSMGAPVFDRKLIPMTGTGTSFDVQVNVDGQDMLINGVSMGNPHAVIFGNFQMNDVIQLGHVISNLSLFPSKTNVEFVSPVSRGEYNCIVYERGCGITLACGTGASALAAVACAKGFFKEEEAVKVHLLGGTLSVMIQNDFNDILLTGPANEVFEGVLS